MARTAARPQPLDVDKMDGDQLKRVVSDLLAKLEVPDQQRMIERMDPDKLRSFVNDLLVTVKPPETVDGTLFVDADRLRDFVTELLTTLEVPPHDAYVAPMTKSRLARLEFVSPTQQVQPKFPAANNIFLIDRSATQIVVMEHR